MPINTLKNIAFLVAVLASFAGVTAIVQANTYLDGMRAGRTTLLLSVVAQPLLDKPENTWTTSERKGMKLALKLALREGQASASALEYAEDYVEKLGMDADTRDSVHNQRCAAQKAESIWTRYPRKLTRLVVGNTLKLNACD